jgi:acyl-CoA thioester hydrolase
MSETYLHRVLYGDTDQMGVVYYASYLRFFEGARNEWIRGRGITYRQIEENGLMLPVYEAGIQYLRPAKYDDLLEIPVEVTHTRVKIRFEYKVRRQGSDGVLAVGHTVHVVVGKDGKPTRAPDWLVQALQGSSKNG